ncbi:MAG: B12-binding domain-containing radical SAM protein [Candidatus Xenobiia bacterium LiM19]
MKVLLIYPPQAQPFLPHLALPSLKAFIQLHSSIEVELCDANIESYEYFLSPEFSSDRSAPVIDSIEKARHYLSSGEDSFDEKQYYQSIEVLQNALKEVSAKYPGAALELKDFRMKYSTSSSEQIIRASRDYSQNPYLEFYEKKLVPRILKASPDIVGISISWFSQLIPAFTLARLIRNAKADLHITIGGSMITHLKDVLVYKRKLFPMVSSFTVYEGETALLELANAIKDGKSLQGVPGLIYPHGKKDVNMNAPSLISHLDELPSPDFEGLPLGHYLSPVPYLPLAASRGCYWNKCAFCSHHYSLSHFRSRTAESVLGDMKKLHERFGASHFYFVDDALPPALVTGLPPAIEKEHCQFYWGGELRFDRVFQNADFSLVHSGGCRFLLFGMESACQRVLDLMNKGIDSSMITEILKRSHQAGIINWVFLFLGFPGETGDEAQMTVESVIRDRDYIDMIAPGHFVMTRNSEISTNPAKFGITRVEKADMDSDFKTSYGFLAEKGISPDEAQKILNEVRTKPEIDKFLKPFVAEVHLMFLGKSSAGKSSAGES